MAAAAMVAYPARGSFFGCRATPAPLRRSLCTLAWTKAAGSTGHPSATATRYNPSVTRAAHAAAAANTPTHASAAANTTYIRELRIRDFALVEEQRVSLHPGLNVITGQSGSGKSVLLEAISQLCGAPAVGPHAASPLLLAIRRFAHSLPVYQCALPVHTRRIRMHGDGTGTRLANGQV